MRGRRTVRARDIAAEAVADIVDRPGRAALTGAGVALGVGALVTTLVVASSAASQIQSRFDETRATDVAVVDTTTTDDSNPYPPDAPVRIKRLPGTVAGGTYWSVGTHPVTALAPDAEPAPIPVIAADGGALSAIGATPTAGRSLTDADTSTGARTAVIGRVAAVRLGITAESITGPISQRVRAVRIDGVAFDVVGIVEATDRERGTELSLVVNSVAADRLWAPAEARRVVVRTDLGAAGVVADALPITLHPTDTKRLRARVRSDVSTVETDVEADTNSLVVALAAVSLLVGTFGIANTTLVSVLERTGEIGLRRALGARRRDIASQFVLEAVTIGAAGGYVGSCVGIAVAVAVTANRSWDTVTDPAIAAVGVPLGAAVGLVASAWPALKAASIEPVEALRR